MNTTICKNCEAELPQTYCSVCGEKRFDKHQLTIKHFAEETLEGMMHFDTKFLRSIKILFSKPGLLSADFVAGRQTRYMKLIAFFLVVNLLFFLLMFFGNPFSLSLFNYITYKPFTDWNTQHYVAEKIARLHITQKEFAHVFDTQIKTDSKAYIFIFIPIYAIFSGLIFIKRKRLIVEHLVFSIHFVAFILCMFFLLTYLITLPVYVLFIKNYSSDFDAITGVLTQIVLDTYFAAAARRFYNIQWPWALIAGAVVGISFFTVVEGYRMLLFFKIMRF